MSSRIITDRMIVKKIPINKSSWIQNHKTNNCHVCQKKIISGLFKSNKHHCRYWYVQTNTKLLIL